MLHRFHFSKLFFVPFSIILTFFNNRDLYSRCTAQARNQLGTSGGANSFLRGAQIL